MGEVYFYTSLMVSFAMYLIWPKGITRHDPNKDLKCTSALEVLSCASAFGVEKIRFFWQLTVSEEWEVLNRATLGD